MHMQATIYKGRRWSTAEAYLRPNSHRSNLDIATEAHVTKVSLQLYSTLYKYSRCKKR